MSVTSNKPVVRNLWPNFINKQVKNCNVCIGKVPSFPQARNIHLNSIIKHARNFLFYRWLIHLYHSSINKGTPA